MNMEITEDVFGPPSCISFDTNSVRRCVLALYCGPTGGGFVNILLSGLLDDWSIRCMRFLFFDFVAVFVGSASHAFAVAVSLGRVRGWGYVCRGG